MSSPELSLGKLNTLLEPWELLFASKFHNVIVDAHALNN